MSKTVKILIGVVALLFIAGKAKSGSPGTGPGPSGNRGLRNNNPGNIRISSIAWQGKVPLSKNTDGVFEQFYSMIDGCRALLKNLIAKIDVHGLKTLPAIIGDKVWGWAPAGDGNNDPAAYAKYISDVTGIGLTTILDTSYSPRLILIGTAIAQMENGKSQCEAAGVNASLFAEAYKLI